jgi:hypothetical protein
MKEAWVKESATRKSKYAEIDLRGCDAMFYPPHPEKKSRLFF